MEESSTKFPSQAFPVLCRILTELKLLQTQVGVIVLCAGVGNDVVGWILLALSVTLVNAGSGITALWVLLTSLGYILFLIYIIRPGFLWVLKKTNSLHNGPTQSVVGLTILMVLASSFFTGIIGIHPIFGAFLVGLICPHDGGFAIKLTEKVEDLVTVFFLPLYFALSGLNTNIGLLDNGITWAYVVGVIAVAFVGKMAGGTLAARANKMVWRESFTIGTLMSCKGLVELIVLNIGLQAKILSVRTFTIFVVMALVTTFATTPLTVLLFPPWYQKKLAAWKRGEIDWDGNRLSKDDSSPGRASIAEAKRHGGEIRKLLVALRLESLPSLFTFVDLLGGEKTSSSTTKVHPNLEGKAAVSKTEKEEGITLRKRPLEVHGLRMLELTERLSSVMKDSEVGEWSARDPVVSAFHTFGQLHNVAVSGDVQLVPEGSYAEVLTQHASDRRSDMILLPWSETGNLSEVSTLGFTEPIQSTFGHAHYNQFVENLLSSAPCNTAIFVNNGFGALPRDDLRNLTRIPSMLSLRSVAEHHPTAPLQDRSHHIFFPFFGGLDDHVALVFVLRLAENPNVTATIIHIQPKDEDDGASSSIVEQAELEASKAGGSATVTTTTTTTTTMTKTAQETSPEQDRAVFAFARENLIGEAKSRVLFEEVESGADVLERAKMELGRSGKNAGDLFVVGRREGKGSSKHATVGYDEQGIKWTLGETAARVINGGVKGSVLVVQAGKKP